MEQSNIKHVIKHLNYQQKRQIIKSFHQQNCLSTVEASQQECNRNFCSNQVLFWKKKKTLTIHCLNFPHCLYVMLQT